MAETPFELTQPVPDKLRVEAPEPPPPDKPLLKVRIAERVRSDSGQRSRLTLEHEILDLTPELEKDELRALLAEMATEGSFGDIKAVVAPSGRVYLFSEKHLIAVEAAEKGRVEEARLAVVEKIRADSSRIALTPAADLDPLFPFAEPERRAELLAEIMADDRFADIQSVTGPRGEVYYHSDRFVSGNYGAIMMRAKAKDPCWAIAELVRDRSRIMPAPSKVTLFKAAVFEIDPAELDSLVGELLQRPEHADVKRLVHRETGAVYLYSDRYLDERRAYDIMDWEEVGALRNP
jgi:hypothetical protein